MRIKEWYSWHFPELKDIVKDNYMYARVIKAIQSRAFFQAEDCVEKLKAVVLDEDVAQDIVNAGRASMGQELNAMDLVSVNLFADKCVRRRCMIIRVIELCKYREDLFEYLQQRMHSVAPNLSALIGEVVGARLISHSGSLVNLAKSPASTIQILGAEKALFRALKTRSNTPKYGIIFHSSFIGRAGREEQGSHFAVPGEQVLDRVAPGQLQRGADGPVRAEDEGAGGAAAELLRDGRAAAEECRCDAGGGRGDQEGEG